MRALVRAQYPDPVTAPDPVVDPTRPHGLRRMLGHERHRVTTPLELLFDLTFVVGFSQAADQLAKALAIALGAVVAPL